MDDIQSVCGELKMDFRLFEQNSITDLHTPLALCLQIQVLAM